MPAADARSLRNSYASATPNVKLKDEFSWVHQKDILSVLEPADIWCAEVLDWEKMLKHDGFKVLDMTQRIKSADGLDIETLRCPIKVDGEIFKSDRAAPKVGPRGSHPTIASAKPKWPSSAGSTTSSTTA